MKKPLYHQNIPSMYRYIFLAQLFFDRSLWVIFLTEKQFSMTDIGIVEALLHLSIVIFEIPTGILCDRFGRKRSLLIGNSLSIVYAILMLATDQIFFISLALMSLGLGITFQSGAEEALLYDSLKETGKESHYTKVFGMFSMLGLISLSAAQLIGGFLAEFSFTYVYVGIIFVHLLAFLPLLAIEEPKKSGQTTEKSEPWHYQLTESLKIWRRYHTMHVPVIVYMLLSTATVIIIFYAQSYFKALGYSTPMIGFIFAVEGLFGALVVKYVYLIEAKYSFIKINRLIYFVYLILFIVFIYSTHGLLIISFLLLSQAFTVLQPMFSNFIQHKLKSSFRATFFSMVGAVESLMIMIAFPLFGWFIDRLGFHISFLGLFIILTGTFIPLLLVKQQK